MFVANNIKIIRLILYPILIILILASYAYVNKKMDGLPLKDSPQEKRIKLIWLNYEEYIEWAERRLNGLKLTIDLARNVHDRKSAYVFLLYMEIMEMTNMGTAWIDVDNQQLDDNQMIIVKKLKNRLATENARAFFSSLEACKNIVGADGYGDNYIRSYYAKKLDELKNAFPI